MWKTDETCLPTKNVGSGNSGEMARTQNTGLGLGVGDSFLEG